MDKKSLLKKIKEKYENDNLNIMNYLRKIEDSGNENSVEDILISYDFQAGSYVKNYTDNPEKQHLFLERLVSIIDSLEDENKSILECGVGEATILVPLIDLLKRKFDEIYGIDISWSRIKTGIEFAKKFKYNNTDKEEININLAVGDMFELPCDDNSFDIVYTRNAIEPNRGKEREILSELYRVARNYVILIEPAYELADEKSRKRMDEMGYITSLYSSSKKLGLNILMWELYGRNANELNPVGIMIIKKDEDKSSTSGWSCPITKTPLYEIGNAYYSKDSLLAYPILNGVPMLTRDNAVVATKIASFK